MSRTRSLPILAASSGLMLATLALAQSTTPAASVRPGASVQSKPAPVSRIERYAKVLHLDETQTLAAKQLYEASTAQLTASNKKTNEAMQESQEDMNDGDAASFEKKMQKAMADQTAATTKITESFLSDLKALLTPEQAVRWPALERYRRRERYLGGAIGIGSFGVGGSNIDVVKLVAKLTIPADIAPKVDEQLALYETDVDRPLRDREKNMEDEQKQMGAVQHFDAEDFAKKQERDRTVDLAIRDVNTKYIRQIAALLPDDLAKQLTDSYQGRAYRSIYREPSIAKKLASSQKLQDLSADQLSQLQALLDKYHRDARAANDKWAAAQQAAETAGRPAGEGMLMLGQSDSGGEKVDPDFAAARAARRNVDNAAKEQLEKILTPEQVAAIPEPPPAMGGAQTISMFGDHGGNGMVFVSDIDLDDMDVDTGPGGGPTMIIRTVTASPVGLDVQESTTSTSTAPGQSQPAQPAPAPEPKPKR